MTIHSTPDRPTNDQADTDPPAPQVVLVAPEIPWNTGNVGRTCLATGSQLHLVRPLGFSLDARRVKRAGLDYWQHVEPHIWPSWDAFAEAIPDLGQPTLFSAEGTVDLWQADLGERPVLIFGSETSGLPTAVRQRFSDRLVRLPMAQGPVRSLNLSTSVAVALYEVLRRRA